MGFREVGVVEIREVLRLWAVDPRGNLSGADPAEFRTDFAYDILGRLITATHPSVSVEEAGGGNVAKATSVPPVRCHVPHRPLGRGLCGCCDAYLRLRPARNRRTTRRGRPNRGPECRGTFARCPSSGRPARLRAARSPRIAEHVASQRILGPTNSRPSWVTVGWIGQRLLCCVRDEAPRVGVPGRWTRRAGPSY